MKKQELAAEIARSINSVSILIGHEKKTMTFANKEVIHYPLFFSEEIIPSISNEYMDSCATAIGLISYKLLYDTTKEDKSIINRAIRGILKMQNQDRSWASVMYQGNTNQSRQLEGIINETCFALNALIACSFLEKDFLYDASVLSEFGINNFSDRINFVIESVKWLEHNKKDAGWYYTTTKHFTEPISILPTASSTISVINTLNVILDKFSHLQINIDIQENSIESIKSLMQNAIDALFDMQKKSGGFSKKRGDVESLAQTSNVLISLLQLNQAYIKTEYEQKIRLSIKWFLSQIHNIYDNEKIDVSDYIDEYNQIIEEGTQILKRPIRHETHLDTHVFNALLQISASENYVSSLSFSKKMILYYHLKKLTHHILNLQMENGRYCGAFKCRRTIQSEQYPIYSTFQAIIGLKKIQNNFDGFYKSYSKIDRYFWQLSFSVFCIIVFVFIYIFGNDTSKWVAFTLGIITNIIAHPIIKRMDGIM